MLYVNGNLKTAALNNQRGSAFVLVIAFMAVTMSIVTVLSQPSINRSTLQNSRSVNVKNTLAAHVRKYASMGSTFRASLNSEIIDANPALKACVLGDANPCIGQGQERPVTLYYPASVGLAGNSLKLVAGPGPFGSDTARGAFYDLKGALCGNAPAQENDACPFEVYSTFSASCPGGAATCNLAQSLMVHFYIHYNSETASNIISHTTQLAPVDEFTVAIDINDILPPDFGQATQNVIVSVIDTTVRVVDPVEPTLFEKAIAEAEITDPALIALLKAAVEGITDKKIVTALVKARITNRDNALAIANAIIESGTTSERAMRAIAGAGITDPIVALMIANSGVTDVTFIKAVVQAGITNPWIVNAMADSGIYDPTVLQAVNNAIAGVQNDYLQRVLASTGITSAEQAMAFDNALAISGVVDSCAIWTMVQEGITDPAAIREVADRQAAEYAAYLEQEAINRAREEAAAAAAAAAEAAQIAANPPAVSPQPAPEPTPPGSVGVPGSSGGEVVISQTQGETTIVVGSADTPVDVMPISTCTTGQCGSIVGY